MKNMVYKIVDHGLWIQNKSNRNGKCILVKHGSKTGLTFLQLYAASFLLLYLTLIIINLRFKS